MLCEGLENDGKASNADGVMTLMNLDELWPAVQNTSMIDHGFWKACPGKCAFLQRYQKFAKALCEMGEYLFRQLPSFQHLPRVHPSAASMRLWANQLPKQLEEWVESTELRGRMQKTCFQRCADQLKTLFSAGLAAVGQVVAEVKKGETPLTQNSVDELMSKVPSDHPLSMLCSAFFKACLLPRVLESYIEGFVRVYLRLLE